MTNWMRKLAGAFAGVSDDRLPFEKDRDLLFQAVRDNDLKKIDALATQYGAEIGEWKSKKGSLLNVAQSKDHLDAFKLLISHGAKIDDNYGEGITPLLRAIKKGQKDFTDYLIDNGANLNAIGLGQRHHDMYSSDDYYTPLHFAVKKRDRDIVVKLLERGANPNLLGSDASAVKFAESEKQFALSDLIKRADKIRADYLAKNPPAGHAPSLPSSPHSPPPATTGPIAPAADQKIPIMNPLHLKKSPGATV